jgi:hypothetical protein
MEHIAIDNYSSKCNIEVDGINREIIFCRNDFNVTFIYLDRCMVCIFIPENTAPYIIKDIRRLYEEKLPVICFGYMDELSFAYGLVIGLEKWNKVCTGVSRSVN